MHTHTHVNGYAHTHVYGYAHTNDTYTFQNDDVDVPGRMTRCFAGVRWHDARADALLLPAMVRAHTCNHVQTLPHAFPYAPTHLHTYAHMRALTHLRMHALMHLCTHACMYLHMYTH